MCGGPVSTKDFRRRWWCIIIVIIISDVLHFLKGIWDVFKNKKAFRLGKAFSISFFYFLLNKAFPIPNIIQIIIGIIVQNVLHI